MKNPTKFCWLFPWLLLALTAGAAWGAIPQSERDALIALFNSTNGQNWQNRSNWRNAENTDWHAHGRDVRSPDDLRLYLGVSFG